MRKTVLIEQTSKKFKLHLLISAIMIIAGFFGFVLIALSQTNPHNDPAILTAAILMLIGLLGILYRIVVRFLIWWHHK